MSLYTSSVDACGRDAVHMPKTECDPFEGVYIPPVNCDDCEAFREELADVREGLDGKQDKLTPGENITIVGNVISSKGGVTPEDWAKKQDKLSPGANITIVGNTISATNTTYSAGEGISITGPNNAINAEMTSDNTYTKEEVDALLSTLEHVHLQEVNTLPAAGEDNVIYLVEKLGGGYEMYVWSVDHWVDLGKDEVDLSEYLKKTDFKANSKTDDGYVAAGGNNLRKFWRTDDGGNPQWGDVVIPINPSSAPTEEGAIWFTT